MYQILQADILDWAKEYQGEPFHAILCDPPYHLVSIQKRFSAPGSKPAKAGPYNRTAKGFMNTSWDGTNETGKGIAFDSATWEALADKLHPGGFIMAFAGTRGYHRMACAMEDAGLIIHPALGWVTLSGFPKATQISNQIDRAAGNVRPDKLNGGHIGMGVSAGDAYNENELGNRVPHVVGKGNHTSGTPIDPLAKTWAGHRYGLQALKPAFEFIAVAQKPYDGRPVDSIVETGAGALWIDGGRIEAGQECQETARVNDHRLAGPSSYMSAGSEELKPGFAPNGQGRWPANFLLTCTCDPNRPDTAVHDADCPVAVLDRQSGELKSGGLDYSKHKDRGYRNLITGLKGHNRTGMYEPDSGPASRIFHRSDFAYEVAEQLANAEPVRYEPKSAQAERNAGLEGNNPHPTLKPLSLTKYLATLLAPPAAYAPRRILIPFSGTGSEMIGAILSQEWEEIVGIEREKKYVKIAERRVKWWSQWPGWGQADVDKILKADIESGQQLSFFEQAA